jgi:hypothetical protein
MAVDQGIKNILDLDKKEHFICPFLQFPYGVKKISLLTVC